MKIWDDGYKDNFLKYNNMLMKVTKEYKYVKMVDVWNIMLDKNGMPEEKLFQKDHLHMTEAGYTLWTKKMKKYVQ
jgi:lysophospholipase L1-like esterase